jgi:hypothetical protein
MTPNLKLELIAAGQAQKHVSINDALIALDALAQLKATSRTQTAPPPAPTDGETYIVPTGATGGFAGHAGDVAVFDGGSWRFYVPSDGWRCYVVAEQSLFVRTTGQWVLAAMPNMPTQLGINASADSTNRLALKSPASLFDNTGSGHQLKINKAATGDTGAILFQTAYSGRAEIGLAGDDKLRCKVSANGTAWKDAITIDQATGLATVFGAPTATNGIATKAHVDSALATYGAPFDYQTASNQTVSTLGVWVPITGLTTARIASSTFDTSQNRFVAPSAGVYSIMAQVVHTVGPAAGTFTVAAYKNGAAAGNWVSQTIAANTQANLSLQSILSLAAGDTVGLAIYAQAATTINFGFTSFFGNRL